MYTAMKSIFEDKNRQESLFFNGPGKDLDVRIQQSLRYRGVFSPPKALHILIHDDLLALMQMWPSMQCTFREAACFTAPVSCSVWFSGDLAFVFASSPPP